MIRRCAAGALAALLVAFVAPAQAHADPQTKCLTNTPKGKQIYLSCYLVNARVNFPPWQRCTDLGPLDQMPKDMREWCGG